MDRFGYISGPGSGHHEFRGLFESLAVIYRAVIGSKAFVPHDELANNLLGIDAHRRFRISHQTSLFIAVPLYPDEALGVELEIANGAGVPALLLRREGMEISPMLLQNPAVRWNVAYRVYENPREPYEEALRLFERKLREIKTSNFPLKVQP